MLRFDAVKKVRNSTRRKKSDFSHSLEKNNLLEKVPYLPDFPPPTTPRAGKNSTPAVDSSSRARPPSLFSFPLSPERAINRSAHTRAGAGGSKSFASQPLPAEVAPRLAPRRG